MPIKPEMMCPLYTFTELDYAHWMLFSIFRKDKYIGLTVLSIRRELKMSSKKVLGGL